MPTYQYACTACEHRFDIVQSFSDASLTECPECAGRLRKLYGSVGVVFKGSGFYRNDSRSEGSAAAGEKSSDKPGDKSGEKSSDKPGDKSGEKSGSAPDAKKADSGAKESNSSSSAPSTTKPAAAAP